MADGVKYDQDKPRWTLLPWREVTQIVAVLGYGAAKYPEADNWKRVAPHSRYADALVRHFTAWLGGERNDPESGLPHLAHAGCCLLFLMWFDNQMEGRPNED